MAICWPCSRRRSPSLFETSAEIVIPAATLATRFDFFKDQVRIPKSALRVCARQGADEGDRDRRVYYALKSILTRSRLAEILLETT